MLKNAMNASIRSRYKAKQIAFKQLFFDEQLNSNIQIEK